MMPGGKRHKKAIAELNQWFESMAGREVTFEEMRRFMMQHHNVWMLRQVDYMGLARSLTMLACGSLGWEIISMVTRGTSWWSILFGLMNIATICICDHMRRRAEYEWKIHFSKEWMLRHTDPSRIEVTVQHYQIDSEGNVTELKDEGPKGDV